MLWLSVVFAAAWKPSATCAPPLLFHAAKGSLFGAAPDPFSGRFPAFCETGARAQEQRNDLRERRRKKASRASRAAKEEASAVIRPVFIDGRGVAGCLVAATARPLHRERRAFCFTPAGSAAAYALATLAHVSRANGALGGVTLKERGSSCMHCVGEALGTSNVF